MQIPFKIAIYLGVSNPGLYKGHSFQRSSATILPYNGEGIKKHKASRLMENVPKTQAKIQFFDVN